jgi:predicted phage tail protein
MITIRLHGYLKEVFGEIFNFEAKTIKEAIHALDCNFSSFRNELTKEGRRYHVVVNDTEDYADINKILFPLAKNSIVDIVPEFEGGGFSLKSVFTVIVGVLLVIYAPALIMGVAAQAAGGSFLAGVAGAAAAGGAATTAGLAAMGGAWAAVAQSVAYLGVSLATMGVASLLAPDPPSEKDGGGQKSTSLSSIENTVGQGTPVPIGYGRMLCGSNVISFISSSSLNGFWAASVQVDAGTGKAEDVLYFGEDSGVDAGVDNNTNQTVNGNTNTVDVTPSPSQEENVTVVKIDYTSTGGGITTYKKGNGVNPDGVIP